MDILVIGAGPAGLLFAAQMKLARPDWRIRLLERQDPQTVSGWGVVVPGRAGQHPANPLSYLAAADALQPQYLDAFRFVHRGTSSLMPIGVLMCGVARSALVQALRARCQALGVEIRYGTSATAGDGGAEYDLVLVANGVGHLHDVGAGPLQPQIEYGSNRYIWYGTSCLFEQMSLIFQAHETGAYVAHAYRYSEHMSTFIVECSAATHARAGLGRMRAQESAAFIAGVFASVLHGQALQLQPEQDWRRFLTLSHDTAYQGRTVLLGDALQSGHFSIGQGTTMAVVEALLLVKALCTASGPEAALAAFDARVMPLLRLFKAHADCSRHWFEAIDAQMQRDHAGLARDFDARRQALPPLPEALAQAFGYALDR